MTKSTSPEVKRPRAVIEDDYATRCSELSKMTIGHGAILFGETQMPLTDAEKLELTTTVD